MSRSRIASLTTSVADDAGDRQPLLDQQQPVSGRVRGLREAASEELGHRLVEVEDDRHAGEPKRQDREHQEVRQRGDLDEREPLAPMEPRRRPRRPHEEVEVLAQVDTEPGTLVALDVEAPDPHAGQLAGRRLSRPSKPERR